MDVGRPRVPAANRQLELLQMLGGMEPILPSATLSLQQATELLGYRDPETVVRLINAGLLPAFRAPGRKSVWRIPRQGVERLLASPAETKAPKDNQHLDPSL